MLFGTANVYPCLSQYACLGEGLQFVLKCQGVFKNLFTIKGHYRMSLLSLYPVYCIHAKQAVPVHTIVVPNRMACRLTWPVPDR